MPNSLLITSLADTFELTNPIKITDTARKPTYAPIVLQTASHNDNKSEMIAILFAVFGTCCCCVFIYTCRIFYKHEVAYEKIYNQFNKYNKVAIVPVTPSVIVGDGCKPTTIEMVTFSNGGTADGRTNTIADGYSSVGGETPVSNDGDVEITLKAPETFKQTSFELHLQKKLFEADSLMEHIINDMETGTNDGSQEIGSMYESESR
eukprot:UN01276